MDAGVLHGKLESSSNSDGTTIIILGPSGQVQMGSGIGRGGDPIDNPFVPDSSPPDRDQRPDGDQPSDAASWPTPIIPLTETLTPTETSSPGMMTDTPAIKSITGTSDQSTETPLASTSKPSLESGDALPSLSSSSARARSRSPSSDSASLSSSTTVTLSSGLSTSSLTSTISTTTTSGRSNHPSLTSHSQTSSLLSSTTASRASATAAYRPLSSAPQELNAHSPSFYVAVSVGAVAGAAVAVALIAWCIRLLTRRRRRARHTTVPWGNPGNDNANRMEGGQAEYVDCLSIGSTGSKAPYARGWQGPGNTDLGDIRCGRFDANGNPLRDHPIIPGRTLPADYAFDEVDLGPNPRPNHNLRHLPSHLVDEDLAARARLETCPIHSPGPPLSLRSGVFAERGPSPVAGGGKSPRRSSSAQQGYEQKLASGEDHAAPPPPAAERLRNVGKSPIATTCDGLGQRPKSDEHQKDDADAWGASLKNSLVNAFNAVAVSISGAPRMGEKDDGPTRRFTRQSVQDVQWNAKELVLTRGASILSTDSKPWTLEETREGAGVVHLHIDDPREYHAGEPTALVPPINRGPPRALFLGGLSRESSIYSTLSAYPEWRERPSRHGSINPSLHSARKFRSLRVANPTRESRQSTLDSVVIQPHPISRLASTASSATHIHDSRALDVDAAASRALRERQRKALN